MKKFSTFWIFDMLNSKPMQGAALSVNRTLDVCAHDHGCGSCD